MASPGSFSAGFASEKRGVSPLVAPAFFAAAAKSPAFASVGELLRALERHPLRALALERRGHAILDLGERRHRGRQRFAALITIQPAGVFTGCDTPSMASANSASAIVSGAADGAARSSGSSCRVG